MFIIVVQCSVDPGCELILARPLCELLVSVCVKYLCLLERVTSPSTYSRRDLGPS